MRAPLTRFDLHVLRRFLTALALLLALLVVTFVTFDYAERVDDFLDRGATMAQVFGTYYPHYAFDMVRLTSPLAAFLAALYVTARLAQSMQLTALHSAGVSLARYARPFALAGLVLTAGLVLFNGYAVPRANRVVFAFQNQYFADTPEQATGGELFRQASPLAVLAVGFFERDAAQAYRVSLVETDTSGGRTVTRRLDAPQMTWDDSLGVWEVRDATLRTFADGRERFQAIPVLDTALAVTPDDLARSERDAQRQTLTETAETLDAMRRAGVTDRAATLVGLHAKIAYPLSTLILILLGVPLAAQRRRGGQAVVLGLGLVIAFLYFAMQRILEPLGASGDLPPVVAVWTPHVVFALVTLAVFLRARRVA